jgi:hypothetical protein
MAPNRAMLPLSREQSGGLQIVSELILELLSLLIYVPQPVSMSTSYLSNKAFWLTVEVGFFLHQVNKRVNILNKVC